MNWAPKNCYKCKEPLYSDNTFGVHIIGGPSAYAVCGSCHDEFVQMMEDLFSSRKDTGYDPEQIKRVNAEWFDAPVVQW